MELRDEIMRKNLELRKRKDEVSRTEKCDIMTNSRNKDESLVIKNLFIMNNLRKKRIESPRGNKNKIYYMLILHQIKLMTSNGFGILLILLEGLKRDIVPTSRRYRWNHRWDLETTNELV